jgi:hypothetical protein
MAFFLNASVLTLLRDDDIYTGDLIVNNGWLLFNNLVGLVGYYCASMVIDIPSIGRRKLQMFSFGLVSIIFFTSAGVFKNAKPQLNMFLYFLSNFFVNFGPNVSHL